MSAKIKIMPIVPFGDPVLRQETEEIEKDYPELDKLIETMFATMEDASGVGLAAPQIGLPIRLFILDASPFAEEYPELDGFIKVFINPIIHEESGKEWTFNEGCLSIPGIREDVDRKPNVTIEYYDQEWNLIEEEYDGIIARVIQHEYDHIEGILFTDHISGFRKRMVKGKLKDIENGIVDVTYKMRFPIRKK
ncbi:MAG: peptide deformylase [Bacteroidia bacterium]|jgi:peptide deformylase